MTSATRARIYRDNASNSTGPVTQQGKNRTRMNAFKHGLTGQHLMLQAHELETYTALTAALNNEHNPQTETERQLVQHVIDCHTRINRATAIENNILNISMLDQMGTANHPNATDSMLAQAKAWLQRSTEIEKLSRYQARLTRQLLQYTKELARVQQDRSQIKQSKPITPETASFRQTASAPYAAEYSGQPDGAHSSSESRGRLKST
jgi:hypothetical protein